jgi:hypothetical protein
MKQFPVLLCLAFLLLLDVAGVAAADSAANTTPANVTTPATTTPERIGGSIFFDTHPSGATIWLDNVEIGTSALTYYTEKTGTLNVLVRKKGYADATGTVTVSEGKRVVFDTTLTPVTYDLTVTDTPAAVITVTTITRKSTVALPTPWPTSAAQSPVDPAVVIGAVALGAGFFVVRRC